MGEPLFHQVSDLSELITKARAGFNVETRAQWYPRLPKIVLGTDGTDVLDMSYSDMLLTCEKKFKNDVNAYELERKIRGVPVDPRSKLNRGKLDRPGVEKVYDVITILSFRYRISSEAVYLVEPLVFHVAAAVRRIDACFSACSDMIRRSHWYITATMLEHRVKIFSFQDLVFLVMPATYSCLMNLKALTDEFLNNIFVGLFFSLLPRDQAYRILDSFLLEGGKILYRYGIALISMFKVSIKAGKYQSGEQFWSDITSTCSSESFNFEELHSLAFDKKSKSFLKMLSRKRKINRRNICELKNQIRVPLEKSMAGTKNSSGTLKLATDICILAAVSTWFDKELWAQSSILDMAMAIKLQLYLTEAMQQHPLNDAESFRETERDRDRDKGRGKGKKRYGSLPPLIPKSLDQRPSVQNLRLVFSSARHGRSLSSLYEMVAGRSPCVLLVKSLNKQAVVGVYVSCAIAPCHKAGTSNQRGDHTCFCFRLNSVTIATGTGSSVSLNTVSFFKSAYARQNPLAPPSAYFLDNDDERGGLAKDKDDEKEDDRPLVREVSEGMGQGPGPRAGNARRSSGVKEGVTTGSKDRNARRSSTGQLGLGLEPYTMSSYFEHVKTDYISGDASVLMFGATASRQPLNAIRLDRELRMCYTAPSETFGNPNLVPEECSPFPVDLVEVYAGNILDTDVDQSLLGLGEWEGKEGVSRDRDEKLTVTTKTEKGSMLSTSSSSAYTSVNASCPLNSKCSDAIRDREEGTAQMEESYTYGSCRKTSHPPPAPHPGPSSCVPGIASGDSREKDKETENEYSYYDGDMDRPWEEETEKGRERAREEDEDDPDFYRKYLVLTPANLGCMPPADDEVSEPQRGAGAGLGTAQPSNQKARGQGQYWEEGEQGREKEKYKENPRLEDVATAEGDAHYVRQSTTSVAFMGESSQGARRAASGMHAPSGAEESLDTGYLRQQQGIGYSRADSHAEEFSTSNALRDLSRAAWGTGAGPSAGAVPAPAAPDTSQVLNYESAGYNQKSVFEGTNSMVMALETRVSTPLPERQVTPKQSTHGY